MRQPGAQGVLSVRVQAHSDLNAVIGHLERRAEQLGRPVVVVSSAGVESSFRDAAQRLGLRAVPHDAGEAAQAIGEEASRRGLLLAVPLVAGAGGSQISQWDLNVAAALSRGEFQALVVLISPRELEVSAELEALSFSVGRELSSEEARRWWDAFSESARGRAQGVGLAGLERWAKRGMSSRLLRGTEEEALASAELSDSAWHLLGRIRIAHRAWPERKLAALGSEALAPSSALAELLAAGKVDLRDGLICALRTDAFGAGGGEPAIANTDRVCVAEALQAVFPADAWAFVRAAELLADAGDGDAAEAGMRRALRMAADASSRSVLWERWRSALERLDDAQRSTLGIRGAELALELGDVDVALVWAERASGIKPRPESALVLGRAALARGDLVSAEAALRRARELGAASDVREAAIAELAEVAYASGDIERARAFAQEVLESEKASVRLSARNLLGKLLLAQAEWDAADAHFASDACEAAFCGERVAELRARINRAIALLSRGSPDEARPILVDVLSSAEQAGEVRAQGFALSNLAVLAIERHDYAQALDLSERAISVFRKLGERLGFARDVTNLVELRLRLGLVDAAEQALTFGRQALGPGAPASRLTELGLAAARVHLARGRTLEAERELRTAMRSATLSSDGDKLCECHRLAVRVALEEGVVLRAEADLARAESLSNNPFSTAEVAILRGLVQRAAGKPDLEHCLQAVLVARETGDEELAREAHVLVAEMALNRGAEGLATEHIRAAVSLRDEVANNLNGNYREVYLARPDLRGLSQLEVLLIEPDSEPLPTPSVRGTNWTRAAARREREYVGRHASVKKLLATVARVGETDSTVLIHGESGSGKELIAEGLHRASYRRSGPLVKVNCGALVETLLLSELFGHEKGAFTGANSRKRGRFERAHGGTLFLDEIGDISPRTQVALLRALEEGSIERVGGSAPISVDVRIVCATHRDLKRLVERGEFREDLYYRLSGITLQVPALRDRLSDLPALCGALLDSIARERSETPKQVDAAALDLLAQHRWPGNVRELENALRVASLFAESNQVRCEDFTSHVEALARVAEAQASAPTSVSLPTAASLAPISQDFSQTGLPQAVFSLPDAASGFESGDDVAGGAYTQIRDQGVSLSDLKRNIERECIARALDETGGNITRAAGVLGMKRPRLSQLVKQYGLTTSQQDSSADDTSSPSAVSPSAVSFEDES
ncbi:MAG: sigma 54-interacting transcriptional regulator [Polyangiaceae bacterium]